MIREMEVLNDFSLILQSKVIICGAGKIGDAVLHKLQSLGKSVEMLCDSDYKKWGKQIEGTDILSYEKLNDKRMEEYLFIIAVESARVTEEIYQILLHKGAQNICTYFAYYYSLKFWESEGKTELMRYYAKQKVWFEDICRHKESVCAAENGAIWVWQVGKVGSTTIVSTFQENGVKAAHLHFLGYDRFLLKILGLASDFFELNQESLQKNRLLIESSKPLKIITLVRDPVVQACSSIFQWMSTGILDMFFAEHGFEKGIQTFIIDSIDREWVWFKDEFQNILGVDVLQYPFDTEKGYTIIERDNIRIFVMQMEKMNNLVKELSDFAGIALSSLSNSNIGNEKGYRWAYRELMNKICLSDEILNGYYDNLFIRHFYSDEDIVKFKSKYSERTI